VHSGLVRIIAAAGATAAVAMAFAAPALAGVLTDEARNIRLTYDDADWQTGDGHWPLACTSALCASVACEPNDFVGGGGASAEDRLPDARISQNVTLELYENAKRVTRPKVVTLGATTGVYWSTKWSSEDGDGIAFEYAFEVLTHSGASWVILACSGETVGGKPIDDLFRHLMTGLDLG
jgi:hypothetical protein